MKKAVLCFAHKSPEQVNILIRQLLHGTNGQTDVYVHFDKNHEGISRSIACGPNVFLIRNNVPVTWGDDSMVRAFENSMREIVATGRSYDYFIVCTGQDLLVKRGLDGFLSENNGRIYMDAMERDTGTRILLTHNYPKVMCRHIPKRTNPIRMLRAAYMMLLRTGWIPERKVNFDYSGWRFWYSFNWSAMPYEVAAYIVRFIDENPGVMELYRNTFLPEDGFLGTFIMNSPYRDRVEFVDSVHTKTLTYIPRLINQHCQFLTMENVPDIAASGCYFSRKFDIATAPDAVAYYERMILEGAE